MLSIGQMSKTCGVSVKTLRHYDKIGLLRPEQTDVFTGYRYYDESQIGIMLLIARYKRYGLSLSQIQELLGIEDQHILMKKLRQQRFRLEREMEHISITIREMEQALQANGNGSTTYTVVAGDTFNAIAYANDMSVSDLKALNPSVDINRLMVGDVLNVKELTPLLSVETVDDVTYVESIPCPVEEVKDSSLYKGSSKIVTQGVEGEAQVDATITYVNGQETGRVINSTTTLREPTKTVKAVGTKEKPKTASSGSYQWPIRGRITSYFGGRYIFGSYSYHSGIDISASYGAAIRAADGGTVTYAGYKGSYGKLVIITHDNGTQTYYGHNSSLLVSAGQKVYKGQQIAKAGSTGRSTGVHCHFEVRVRGSSVNPLSYLP